MISYYGSHNIDTLAQLYSTRIQNLNDVIYSMWMWTALEVGAGVLVLVVAVVRAVVRQLPL